MSKPFHVLDFMSLFVEHVDEAFADDFALALRVGDAFQLAEELFGSVDADNVQSEALIVVEYVAELVFAQHSVVYKDAGEILSDGAVEKHSRYR